MATKKKSTSTATRPAKAASKPARRKRATNEEMRRRAEAVLVALNISDEPLTIEDLSGHLDLNYSATNSLLRLMTAQGKIESAGRVGRNLTFRAIEEPESVTEADDELPETDEETEVAEATPMRPVPMKSIVGQLLLGSQVEVVGLHLQDDETVIDLRSPEGTIVSVVATSVTGS